MSQLSYPASAPLPVRTSAELLDSILQPRVHLPSGVNLPLCENHPIDYSVKERPASEANLGLRLME